MFLALSSLCYHKQPEKEKAMLPFERLLTADELGVRLEIVGGLPIWEAHPLPKHQFIYPAPKRIRMLP